jgi:hypothetical protein
LKKKSRRREEQEQKQEEQEQEEEEWTGNAFRSYYKHQQVNYVQGSYLSLL